MLERYTAELQPFLLYYHFFLRYRLVFQKNHHFEISHQIILQLNHDSAFNITKYPRHVLSHHTFKPEMKFKVVNLNIWKILIQHL